MPKRNRAARAGYSAMSKRKAEEERRARADAKAERSRQRDAERARKQRARRFKDDMARRRQADVEAGLAEAQRIEDETYARLQPDDSKHRPRPVDPLTTGPLRVTSTTARAAARNKAMLRTEYAELDRTREAPPKATDRDGRELSGPRARARSPRRPGGRAARWPGTSVRAPRCG